MSDYLFPENEVRLLVLQPNTDDPDGPPDVMNAKVVAAAYDSSKGPIEGGRQLAKGETGESLDDFVEDVMLDMDSVGQRMTSHYAKKTHDEHASEREVFLSILIDCREMPLEVICNLLATVITGCAHEVASDEDYTTVIAELDAKVGHGYTPPTSVN